MFQVDLFCILIRNEFRVVFVLLLFFPKPSGSILQVKLLRLVQHQNWPRIVCRLGERLTSL